jgi:hypothetical protein
MSLYSVALFVHIVGAVLIFVALTIEGVGLRVGFSAAPMNRVLGPIAAVAILVPGAYMMWTLVGWTGWVVVGIATYVVIAGVGAYTGISVMRGRLSNRAATVSWLIRIGLALGVVFDMTVKPNLAISLFAVLVGAALGAAASVARRREVASA